MTEDFATLVRNALHAEGFWAPESIEELKKAVLLAISQKEHLVLCSKLQRSCINQKKWYAPDPSPFNEVNLPRAFPEEHANVAHRL